MVSCAVVLLGMDFCFILFLGGRRISGEGVMYTSDAIGIEKPKLPLGFCGNVSFATWDMKTDRRKLGGGVTDLLSI